MAQKIIELLNGYISNELLKRSGEVLDPTQALISGGIIDSFSLVDIALFVEETWGVHIDETELNSDAFDSINELATLVRQKQKD